MRADDELGVLARFVERARHQAWLQDSTAVALQWALGLCESPPSPDAMKKLRSRTRAALAKFVARHAPTHRHAVALRNRQVRKSYQQRLELDPVHLRIEGLAPATDVT